MEAFLVQIINMSREASFVIVFILAARLLLGIIGAAKKYSCLLWFIPFFRLAVPFTIESAISLLPRIRPLLSVDTAYLPAAGIHVENSGASAAVSPPLQAVAQTGMNFMQTGWFLIRILWLAGVMALLLFSVISYIRLKKKLRCSICLGGNEYLADYINTPFVMGVIRPRIYIPSSMEKKEKAYALVHEQMHIKRWDYIWKSGAFLLLTLHWFNPLVWAAYILFCRDMEMACDEAVMRHYGEDCKKEYARTLLNCTVGTKRKTVPLAFAEGSPKRRIQNIMRYKKPLIAVSAIAIAAIILLAAGLLSNPLSVKENTVKDGTYVMQDKDGNNWHYITVEAGRMGFSYSPISSHFPYGSYEIADGILTLLAEGGYQYRFRIGRDSLTFLAEGSSEVMGSGFSGIPDVVDGSVFTLLAMKVEDMDTEETVEITAPTLRADMPLGADGPVFDYEDGDILIFHDYFGLFVYSLDSRILIGAVDLKAIGCDSTQGDNYCEVSVAADGSHVFLAPLSQEKMYVYNVAEQSLGMTSHDLSDIALFDKGNGNMTVMERYGKLFSQDGTIGGLTYEKGGNTFPLFADILNIAEDTQGSELTD